MSIILSLKVKLIQTYIRREGEKKDHNLLQNLLVTKVPQQPQVVAEVKSSSQGLGWGTWMPGQR